MSFKKLLIASFSCFLSLPGFSQLNLYIPVSLNAPYFKYDKEFCAGVSINNYGFNENFGFKKNNVIYELAIQHNDGKTQFNPFHFSQPVIEEHLVQFGATKMMYVEAAVGYSFGINKKTLKGEHVDIVAGTGRDLTHDYQRYFVQADLSNDFGIVNMGISARGNYTTVEGVTIGTLEPMIQAKVKIYDVRIVSQFGTSIILKKEEDYMVPVFMVGLSYVFHDHKKPPVKDTRSIWD